MNTKIITHLFLVALISIAATQQVKAATADQGVTLFDSLMTTMFRAFEADDEGLSIITKSQGPRYKIKGLGFERVAAYDETFLINQKNPIEFKSRNTTVSIEKSSALGENDNQDQSLDALLPVFYTVEITRDLRSFGGELQTDKFGLLTLHELDSSVWSAHTFFKENDIRASESGSDIWVWKIVDTQ